MTNFSYLLEAARKDLAHFLELQCAEHSQLASLDVLEFLAEIDENFERWAELLAKGDLSRDDFEWLVIGKKALIKFPRLSGVGWPKDRLESLRTGVINTLLATTFKTFLAQAH